MKRERHIIAEGYFDNSSEGYIVRLGEKSGYHTIEIPARLRVKENENGQIISPRYRLVLERIA